MRTKRWSRGASLVAFAFFAFCFLICLIIAVVCFTDAAGGLDDHDIIRGKFHVSSEAEDPVTGISGAVVLRTTKMLQYREKGYEHTDGSYAYEVEEVWEEKHIESFFQGFQKYNNPDFPEKLKTEAFYGKAEIGNIPVSKWLLSCFRWKRLAFERKSFGVHRKHFPAFAVECDTVGNVYRRKSNEHQHEKREYDGEYDFSSCFIEHPYTSVRTRSRAAP